MPDPCPQWFVYLLRCSDHSLYTGVTIDVERRIIEHNQDDKKAAKYVKPRRPVTLAAAAECTSKVQAYRVEFAIKRMSKQQKERLLQPNTLSEFVLSINQ